MSSGEGREPPGSREDGEGPAQPDGAKEEPKPDAPAPGDGPRPQRAAGEVRAQPAAPDPEPARPAPGDSVVGASASVSTRIEDTGRASEITRTGSLRRRPETLIQLLRRFSRLWGFLVFLLFVVVLFRGIVLPFIFAMLLAYLLAPSVARLQPRVGRVWGVILIYLAIVALLSAFIGLLVPAVFGDIVRLRDTAPDALAKLNQDWLPRADAWVDETFREFLDEAESAGPDAPPVTGELVFTPREDGTLSVDMDAARIRVVPQADGSWVIGGPAPPVKEDPGIAGIVRDLVEKQGAELPSVIGPFIQNFVAGVTNFLTGLVITFMLAAFVLIDVNRVNRFIRSLVPYDYRADFEELWAAGDKGLSGVIRGQLVICAVNGFLTFVGLVIFQVKYSFLLALLAGGFSLIPIFGTIISSIPIVLIALVGSESGAALGPAVGILAWIAGIHLLEANVLNPKIIGDAAHIHPVIVIFALLAGESAYGLTGALLAVPCASLVQTAFLFVRRRSTVFSREPREPAREGQA